MLKKVIKYTDFDGVEKNEAFYFNLTRAEGTEIQYSGLGGKKLFSEYLQDVADTQDPGKLIAVLKTMLLASYGKRLEDGSFVKSKELSEAFSHTEAYSVLFNELAENPVALTEFFKNVLPKGTIN